MKKCTPLEIKELGVKSNLPSDSFENSIFYSKFENFLVEFNQVVVASPDSNTVATVDRVQLSKNTVVLNNFVRDSVEFVTKEVFKDLYPNLNERIEKGVVITQIETLEFINEYLYDFETFPSIVTNPGNTVVLSCLDTFYSPENISRSSMGSFCDLIQSIFGKVSGLFEKFKDIADFAGNLPSLVNGIQNFSAASLIKTLREKILATVDKLAKNSLSKLKNFGLDFANSSAGSNNNGPIFSKVDKTKGNISKFFSKENVDKIKERIKGLIGYVISLFEKPDIEEIQFIIYRFCKLISELENLFNGVFKPLYDIRNDYEQTQTVLRGNSGYNSAFAVSAGAVRLSDDQRVAGYNEGSQIVADSTPPGAGGGGGADSGQLAMSQNQPISNEEVGNIPTWEDIRLQNDRDGRIVLDSNESIPEYIPRGAGKGMGPLSWNKTTLEAKVTLLRFHKNLSAALGRNIKFLINSAYRSEEYNSGLKGSATKSLHLSGMAFDISTTGSTGLSSADRTVFMNVARQSGFRGIGKYKTFIHVDLGRERTWGSF